jgi:OmpA-OmpF porin, OOP family
MRVWTLPAALGLALTLLAPDARATDCAGTVSSCIDDDVLWPHAGPSQFVAVGSTQTIAPGQLGFGLVSTYLKGPIVFTSPSPGTPTDQYAINNQVNGTFLWSYGVTDRLQLDVDVPLTFIQNGAGLEPVTGGAGLKDTAVRDMRFGFAYAVVAHPRTGTDPGPFGLAARLEVSAPTGDADQFGGENTGVFVPSVSADWRHERLFAGAELGARVRPTTQLLSGRIGTELVTVLGVGYDVLPRHGVAVTLEAWALPDLVRQASIAAGNVSTLSSSYIVPSEWQLGARWAPLRGGDLSVQASGGGGIPIGDEDRITTPKFRFTLGVRWAPVAHDTDGDGVPDLTDRCPTQPAHTPNGCPPTPESGPTAPAVDLHLSSAHDACTDEPDLVDGFKDTDGCPDEDQDKDGIPDRFDKCPREAEDFAGAADGCPEKK